MSPLPSPPQLFRLHPCLLHHPLVLGIGIGEGIKERGVVVARRSGLPVNTTPELKKPSVRLPSIVGLVGAAGIGLVIGRTIP
ncbi:MAG: hypothetical protein JSW71_08880 [Gemmatimonadota bacterium]|nr:MAG: hypothetical protein JSW71_08880 [Gemmatimonadota bacterium]